MGGPRNEIARRRQGAALREPADRRQASRFPVAINTMGSEQRMALALQVESIGDLAQEIALILKAKPPTDLREGWSLLKQGLSLLHARPKHVKSAACQEVVHRFDDGAPGDFSLDRSADPEMLAAGWRALHHVPKRPHARSRNRRAQSRHVSHAGLRRPHDRDALAGAQGRRAPRQTLLRARRAHAGRGHASAATRPTPSPRPRRCPTASTKFSSPASCARNRSSWSSA